MSKIVSSKNLAQRYSKNPLLRSLIQLVPLGIGSTVDTALMTIIENIRLKRLRDFFDELQEGKIQLSPELIESEDFLHCYFSTLKASMNTRRSEKIKLFAKLLSASFREDRPIDIDEYEEFLSIIDELSYRELYILFKLYKYYDKYPKQENESDHDRANRFWDEFLNDICNDLGLIKDEFNPLLTRLNRTGCYEPFVGTFWENDGEKGKLTSVFYKIKELIRELV